MPRTKRDYLLNADVVVHTWNSGVAARDIFPSAWWSDRFMELLLRATEKMPVSVLVYMLMPEVFHLVLHQHEPRAISPFLKEVCETYAERLNRRERRSGHVFAGRYKGDPIYDPEGLLRVSHDMHGNFIQSDSVSPLKRWTRNSCLAYVEENEPSIVDRSVIWGLVGGANQYARFLKDYNPTDPASVKKFLCPEYAVRWAEKSNHALNRKGETSGPG